MIKKAHLIVASFCLSLFAGTLTITTITTITARAQAPAATAPSVDAVKAEIDARMAQIRNLLADGKLEEFERSGNTPDEWKAKLAADPKALETAIAMDKAHPDNAAMMIEMVSELVKRAKPTLSADGTMATYKLEEGSPVPFFVLKKVDGVWYPSEKETMKATPAK